MSDEIVLTLPRSRPVYRIAHLVLGGLAVRLDLTFEHLEDLQIALDGLLNRPDGEDERDVTVRVRIDGSAIRTAVGPFVGREVRAALARDTGELPLRRLLEAVVDHVEVDEREDGDWVELTKTVELVSR